MSRAETIRIYNRALEALEQVSKLTIKHEVVETVETTTKD